MKKKFIASIHNEHIYVKWLKNAFIKGKEFLNIYRNKAVKKEKETGFKNGRLLDANSHLDFLYSLFETYLKSHQSVCGSIHLKLQNRYEIALYNPEKQEESCRVWAEINQGIIYRNKAVKKEKETGFKNGRLLVLLKKRGMGLTIPLSISNLANMA